MKADSRAGVDGPEPPVQRSSPFLESLEVRAAALQRRVVLPEADDPRTLDAVADLVRRGLVRPVLVVAAEGSGTAERMTAGLRDRGVDPAEVQIRDPAREASPLLVELEAQGLDPARMGGADRLLDPLWFGVGLVAAGHADACVAGAVHATPDVIRAALRMVGKSPGIRTVSSAFYMDLARGHAPSTPSVPLTFTDAGVVPDPTPEQLAEIAVSAARARRLIVGDEPKVAFLSYSTAGSASGSAVEKVRRGLEMFRRIMPDVLADGELQADAALIPEVRRLKAPDSPLEGSANILVFPNLDAGNIAYKLVQRLADAVALGPVLQGLAKPVHDLSRGASANDIVLVSCIASLESAAPGA